MKIIKDNIIFKSGCLILCILAIHFISFSNSIMQSNQITPTKEIIELNDEELTYCSTHNIENIMLEYYEGRSIKALTPKLGTMLSLATDYEQYIDGAELNREIWEEDLNKNKISMIIIDTLHKTIELKYVNIGGNNGKK